MTDELQEAVAKAVSNTFEKYRVYIDSEDEAPDDATVQEGSQGGLYYERGNDDDDDTEEISEEAAEDAIISALNDMDMREREQLYEEMDMGAAPLADDEVPAVASVMVSEQGAEDAVEGVGVEDEAREDSGNNPGTVGVGQETREQTADAAEDILAPEGDGVGALKTLYDEVYGERPDYERSDSDVAEEMAEDIREGELSSEDVVQVKETVQTLDQRQDKDLGDRDFDDVVLNDTVSDKWGKKIAEVREIDEEEGVLRGPDQQYRKDVEIKQGDVTYVRGMEDDWDFWDDYEPEGGHLMMAVDRAVGRALYKRRKQHNVDPDEIEDPDDDDEEEFDIEGDPDQIEDPDDDGEEEMDVDPAMDDPDDDETEKSRIYVDSEDDVPDQYQAQTGPNGGVYYETGEASDLGGAGTGVGVTATMPGAGATGGDSGQDSTPEPAENPAAWVEPDSVSDMDDGTEVEIMYEYDGEMYDATGEVDEGAVNLPAGGGRFHPEDMEAIQVLENMEKDHRPPSPAAKGRKFIAFLAKDRRYVDDPNDVPEEAEIQEGPRGGYYYDTDDLPGDDDGDSGSDPVPDAVEDAGWGPEWEEYDDPQAQADLVVDALEENGEVAQLYDEATLDPDVPAEDLVEPILDFNGVPEGEARDYAADQLETMVSMEREEYVEPRPDPERY